jgi:hypothetical protein
MEEPKKLCCRGLDGAGESCTVDEGGSRGAEVQGWMSFSGV